MQRRTVIVGLAGIGAAGAGYLWFAQPSTSRLHNPLRRRPIPGLDSVFWLPIAALLPESLDWRPLGERLVDRVEEEDIQSLVHALSDTPGFLKLRGDTLRKWLAAQAKADFAADRQVTVKGWHFAQTEARMMALIWHLRERDSKKRKQAEGEKSLEDTKSSNSGTKGELAVVVPLGDPARGKKVYAQHCQSCHQSDGKGVGGKVAADLNGADGPLQKSNEALFEVISEGVQGDGAMPAMGDHLSDQEIGDVIAWMRKRFGVKEGPVKSKKP